MFINQRINQRLSMVAMILLLSLTASCQLLSPCNNKVMKKVLGVIPVPQRTDTLQQWSEGMFVAFQNVKESTLSWDIQSRNDYGCVVTLSGDVNGVKTEGYVWFVDLDKNLIYADNDNAKGLVAGWVQGSGDLDLLSGIPLP